MSVTTRNKAGAAVIYSFYRQSGNRTTLIGPNHSDASKDVLVMNQRDPVAQKGDDGFRRSDAEFQQTVAITKNGVTTAKVGRVAVSSSLPVGMDPTAIDELFARAAALAKEGTNQNDFFVLGKRPS